MSNVVKLRNDPVGKVCTKCDVEKSSIDFYKRSATGYLTSMCKECHKADCAARRTKHNLDPELMRVRNKKWRDKIKADPVKHRQLKDKKNEWNRSDKYFDSYFKRKFGVSLEVVTSMLSNQSGLCANVGCGKSISILPSEGEHKAVVDHCHATGKVRSMMCVRCNSLLGHIENDRGVVRGLMNYLTKY